MIAKDHEVERIYHTACVPSAPGRKLTGKTGYEGTTPLENAPPSLHPSTGIMGTVKAGAALTYEEGVCVKVEDSLWQYTEEAMIERLLS